MCDRIPQSKRLSKLAPKLANFETFDDASEIVRDKTQAVMVVIDKYLNAFCEFLILSLLDRVGLGKVLVTRRRSILDGRCLDECLIASSNPYRLAAVVIEMT